MCAYKNAEPRFSSIRYHKARFSNLRSFGNPTLDRRPKPNRTQYTIQHSSAWHGEEECRCPRASHLFDSSPLGRNRRDFDTRRITAEKYYFEGLKSALFSMVPISDSPGISERLIRAV